MGKQRRAHGPDVKRQQFANGVDMWINAKSTCLIAKKLDKQLNDTLEVGRKKCQRISSEMRRMYG